MGRPVSVQSFILLLVALLPSAVGMVWPPATLAEETLVSPPPFTIMREALRQTLHLQFAQAMETVAQMESDEQPTPASQLTRGMIAYFQSRWQTRQAASVRQTGHEALQSILEADQKLSADKPQDQLFIGLAAIFAALLQQEDNPLANLQLFAQGQSRLQQTLIRHETMTDAHLGLGLMYFSGTALPTLLRRFLSRTNRPTTDASIYHLQRAAEAGQFSPEVAKTFLLRIYELEGRPEEAIALGQRLQEMFPENGYYALLTGRSQYAHRDYPACATTLGRLATWLEAGEAILALRHDRFDLYYFWGLALKEIEHYDEAFPAFRQAINEDPRTRKDETLWAKYYLATLYERRGQAKTARQIYHTLLRGRNVEDLHDLSQSRLARLK